MDGSAGTSNGGYLWLLLSKSFLDSHEQKLCVMKDGRLGGWTSENMGG
jgi:hypothetical protein